MNKEELKQVLDLAKERDEKRYAFLRNLLTLAAGCLSVMVSLQTGAGHTPGIFLRLSWVSMSLGILAAAAALYAEVTVARSLVRNLVAWLRTPPAERSAAPILAGPQRWQERAERVAYGSWALGLLLLVLHTWS